MQARDTDSLGPVSSRNLNETELRERFVILRNLVALGQIGVKVILAREDRSLTDAAVQRHGSQDGKLDRLTVQDR
jgi:hypothetical protein